MIELLSLHLVTHTERVYTFSGGRELMYWLLNTDNDWLSFTQNEANGFELYRAADKWVIESPNRPTERFTQEQFPCAARVFAELVAWEWVQ